MESAGPVLEKKASQLAINAIREADPAKECLCGAFLSLVVCEQVRRPFVVGIPELR